jgi:phospholipid transport system substrate-binding protein
MAAGDGGPARAGARGYGRAGGRAHRPAQGRHRPGPEDPAGARHWAQRAPKEREEFSQLFADLIERSYVSKIELYSGERIVYAGETAEGDQATVRTKLVTKSNTEVPIDYRMLKEGDRWRTYDVVIEGVSLVGNYRTQFNRIIQQSGFDELMKKLKTKQDELGFEEGEKGKKK